MKWLWFIFSLLLGQTSNANEKEIEHLFSLSLEELLKIQVTGATLTPQSLKTVPSAVTVFRHHDIKRLGLDSLDELMNLVPGFQSYRSSTSAMQYIFSSRGRRIGNPSAEVLIIVDGHRLDDPRTSGSAVIVPIFSLEQVDRVEFIRGPGSAVYGSNAMLGIINIITQKNVNRLNLAYGSNNKQRIELLASHNFSEIVVNLFAHLEKDSGESYRLQDSFSNNKVSTNDPREIANINLKISRKESIFNLQHYQFKAENFYELDRISNGVNLRKTQLSSLSFKQNYHWRAINSYLWFSYSRSTFETASQLTAPGELAAVSDPASNAPLFVHSNLDDYSESRLQWNNIITRPKSSVVFGAEFRRIKAPNSYAKSNFDIEGFTNRIFPVKYYPKTPVSTLIQASSQRNISGIYAQYQRDLMKNSHLTLGLRYDNFSNISSELSPRFALVTALTNEQNIKLIYGESFRAPAENELNLVNNPVIVGNKALIPETVKSIELIWTGQWLKTLASLGYFENRFKNAITLVGRNDRLEYQNLEAQSSYTKGFELELSHQLNRNYLLRASLFIISENTPSSFREAKELASFTLIFSKQDWDASLIAAFHGKRDMAFDGSDKHRFTLDDYWVLYGKVRYQLNPRWTLFLDIKNLQNQQYLTPPLSTVLTEGVKNRGRELAAGVELTF